VRIGRNVRPVTSTLSVTLAVTFLIGVAALLWLTEARGMSLGRGMWDLTIAVAAVGIGGLAVSNRLRHRARALLNPILASRRVARREVRARVEEALGGIHTLEALRVAIPPHVRDLAGVEPVTLFLADRSAHVFRPVTSTLETVPQSAVEETTPLVRKLRRRRRAIHLLGNTDDLGLIPIYVENSAQIIECGAVCAVPLLGDEKLLGFLLCGGPGTAPRVHRAQLALLDQAARLFAARLRSLRPARLDTGPTLL
jgi:hypothetical protein